MGDDFRAGVSRLATASPAVHMCQATRVLPPFADRPPLVVCVGMGGAVARAARRRNVITAANSARRYSGKAESGSSNVGKTQAHAARCGR